MQRREEEKTQSRNEDGSFHTGDRAVTNRTYRGEPVRLGIAPGGGKAGVTRLSSETS